jgi:hypothetical protein
MQMRLSGEDEEPRCEVELTEVQVVPGQTGWTLAFEATGPVSLLSRELCAAAAFVFTDALPGGVELGAESSQSHAHWLTSSPALSPSA